MSRLLVTQYQTEVEKIIRYGGSKKETSIRNAFERLCRLQRTCHRLAIASLHRQRSHDGNHSADARYRRVSVFKLGETLWHLVTTRA
ncbi:MAG: hypothetical protein D6742_07495 [Cyanobacteria bacterium J069]|nr:MAG: hypothetical protein D6742_07495 [Cyanobacteria bacterium J069]